MHHRSLLTIAVTATLLSGARADVTLHPLFSDHTVLQRAVPVRVWGWADAGEAVTVTFAGQSKNATAAADGKWSVKLDALKVGEPQVLTAKGKNTVTVNDVLVGEVWLCSGQSNMGMNVQGSQNFPQEKDAANHPLLRMFTVHSGSALTPQEKCDGTWQVSAPEVVGGFSAAAYFFGREVQEKLGVPVGLIHSSVGGTAIEAWTSMDVMKPKAELAPLLESWEKQIAAGQSPEAQAKHAEATAKWKEAVEAAKAAGTPAPRAPAGPGRQPLDTNRPANLFNGKIAPLVGYTLRGAIWYQGEANAGNGPLYALQLPLMIADWRQRWGAEFPFAWVQLPFFQTHTTGPDAPAGWASIREAMTQSLAVPNSGMAIALELGEAENIHPKNKQEVGHRLALWARAKVYGEKIPYSGPLYAGHEIKGSEVIVRFQHTDGGLKQQEGELNSFAIAGADKVWHWAKSRIVGETLIVSSPEVPTPAALRYAWASNPDVILFNGAGLPAGPFRTDDWK